MKYVTRNTKHIYYSVVRKLISYLLFVTFLRHLGNCLLIHNVLHVFLIFQ